MATRRAPQAKGDEVYARIRGVVAAIPAGRVATYGQVAALAGIPGHARQVGYAMRTLPEGSRVPWQRVLNGRGEVSRRAGEGFELGPSQGFQRHLLREEGVVFDAQGRVDLARYGWEAGEPGGRRRRFSARAELAQLAATLSAAGSAARAAAERRYLRSELDFLGADVPTVRRTARAWLRRHPEAGRAELLALARLAWRGRVHELRSVALELLVMRGTLLEPGDLPFLEWMLRRAGTWAHVDVIAPALVGAILERDARVGDTLDRWLRDEDFWLRRAAVLALLGPLRRGPAHWRRFVRAADALLGEREFFIRKALGWVLREVSKRDPRAVVRFVAPRLARLSGVTFKEAVRRLPAAERAALEVRRAALLRRPVRGAARAPRTAAPARRARSRGSRRAAG